MKKLKRFTAVVTIGNGTPEVGFFKTTVEVEAFSEKKAKEKAVDVALKSTDVTVVLSATRNDFGRSIYDKFFGNQSEAW